MKNGKDSVGASLGWAFAERILAQVVTLIVTVILARLLDPEQYALVAVVSIFITIANVFVTSGYGNALIQKKDADLLDFSSTLFLALAVSIVLYGILFFTAPLIAGFYKTPELCPVLRVMSLRLIVAAINTVQHAYVSKKMQFRKFFFSTLIGTIVSAIIGILFAYKGFGVWALVAQYMTNTTIDTIVLAFTCGWRPIFSFSLKRMKRLFAYGSKLLASDIIGTVYEQLHGLILSKVFKPTDLSYYNQGSKYPELFINNIEASVHKVMFQVLSDSQDSLDALLSVTRKTIRISTFSISPIFWGLAACGNSLVELLLTKKWLPCVPYLQIICLIDLIHPLMSSHTRLYKAIGRSDVFLRNTCVRYGVGIALLISSAIIFKNPYIVSLTGLITLVVMCVICAIETKRLIAYSFIEQIKDIAGSLLIGFFMYAIVSNIRIPNAHIFVQFLIQVTAGAVFYLSVSYLFNRAVFKEMLTVLQRRKA